mgnify:CR=1 FL=1
MSLLLNIVLEHVEKRFKGKTIFEDLSKFLSLLFSLNLVVISTLLSLANAAAGLLFADEHGSSVSALLVLCNINLIAPLPVILTIPQHLLANCT